MLSKINFESLKGVVEKALREFYENDSLLFNYTTTASSERSMVFRIGHYMQNAINKNELYNGLIIDCEYNRHGNNVKQIKKEKILPDLILHKRKNDRSKNDESNILIMEFKKYVKKSNRGDGWINDLEKLKYLTNKKYEYGYRYGFHVVLKNEEAEISVYNNGEEQKENNFTFNF